MSIHQKELEAFGKINFTSMNDIEVARWMRDVLFTRPKCYSRVNISDALLISKLLKEAYRLGEIRGRTVGR